MASISSLWANDGHLVAAFTVSPQSSIRNTLLSMSTSNAVSKEELQSSIDKNLEILYRAAETKQEDSDAVYNALVDLEKQMRQLSKLDYPAVAEEMKKQLNGDWRLVFTTGTANTQKKIGGKVNYFPIKAVQSFRTVDTDPMTIENGIYAFDTDFALIKFQGLMDFDLKKRKLEFDFDKVTLFSFLDINLGKGEAAQLGAKSGLGSESNVANAKRDQKAFFNWISADGKVATARGGGGGLALWKRV